MTLSIPVEVAAAVAVPLATVVVWLLRLEGRINMHEAAIDGVKEDLRYIRERIDQALDRQAGV